MAPSMTAGLGWQRLTDTMRGRAYVVPRDTVWVGPVDYRYSGLHHEAASWPDVLPPLRCALEAAVEGAAFETVLGNRYRNGHDQVRWHADDEPTLGKAPVIASASFGATRTFKLRNNATREVIRVELEPGSLLVMGGATQLEYQHCIPEEKRVTGQRINLAFRTLDSDA